MRGIGKTRLYDGSTLLRWTAYERQRFFKRYDNGGQIRQVHHFPGTEVITDKVLQRCQMEAISHQAGKQCVAADIQA